MNNPSDTTEKFDARYALTLESNDDVIVDYDAHPYDDDAQTITIRRTVWLRIKDGRVKYRRGGIVWQQEAMRIPRTAVPAHLASVASCLVD